MRTDKYLLRSILGKLAQGGIIIVCKLIRLQTEKNLHWSFRKFLFNKNLSTLSEGAAIKLF